MFILKSRANNLHLLLFSATFPLWVKNLALKYLKQNFKYINLA